jgi:hypothetical protein
MDAVFIGGVRQGVLNDGKDEARIESQQPPTHRKSAPHPFSEKNLKPSDLWR